MARNFSLKAFYRKPVVPIPKDGIHPITLPDSYIGRHVAKEMLKLHEKVRTKGNADIRNGKQPLLLFMNFNSPWVAETIILEDSIVFSPIDKIGMKLWSDMHVPFSRKRWVRVTFTGFLLVGFGMASLWFANQQKVPITERNQLVILSDEIFMKLANSEHQKLLRKQENYVLPNDHPTTVAVKEVFDHLLASSGSGGEPEEWEIFVVNAPSVRNATVFYNKKVWVYSGILDVAQDTNGIAVALSHEIAHVLASHGPERVSNQLFWTPLGLPAFALFIPALPMEFAGFAILWSLPWGAKMYQLSRSTEREADYIGLTIMARAGYDIQEAAEFWERMSVAAEEEKRRKIQEKALKGKVYKENPDFLRTHPTDEERLRQIQKMIPEIISKTGWQ